LRPSGECFTLGDLTGDELLFGFSSVKENPDPHGVQSRGSRVFVLSTLKEGMPHRVVIADDQPEARLMLAHYLSQRGFAVYTAVDGLEAIDVAARVHPALVLMDLLMPRMDGWQAIRALRTSPMTQHIRIVVVAGCSVPNSEQMAFQAGCDEVLKKPIDFDRLDDILNRLPVLN
jgi:two-component system, cell cycle response regulator DivK